jgi:predicted nucleotidyltransferase
MKATDRRASASSLLFPAGYRRQVLSLLLLHPERSLHVREIARLTRTTAGTLNKELTRLHEAGLLNRERVGNQVQYSANRSHQIYPELAGILRKTVGLADVLIEALTPLAHDVKVAFVFGSMARGTETTGSDVDLLIIGGADFGSVVDALHPAQQQLGREINPKVFSVREWKAKLRSKDSFLSEIMAEPKIFLIGGEDELAELDRRKP